MLAALPPSEQGAEDPLISEGGTLMVWSTPNTGGLGTLLQPFLKKGLQRRGLKSEMCLCPWLCGWDGHAKASQASITEQCCYPASMPCCCWESRERTGQRLHAAMRWVHRCSRYPKKPLLHVEVQTDSTKERQRRS